MVESIQQPYLASSVSNDDLLLTPSDTLCVVTGVNGFVARHLAFQLLCKGYRVIGTIRPPSQDLLQSTHFDSIESYAVCKMPYLPYWFKMFPNDQFSIRIIDFTKDENARELESIFEGAYCVFHTASPVFFKTEPPSEEEAEEMYYKPAVDGTRIVLEACETSKVQRVVITSSAATLFNPYNPPRSGIVSECDWNQSSKLTDIMGAYRISKVKAEKYAWEFCRYLTTSHKIQLVSVLPTFVIGPPLPNKVVDEVENKNYLNQEIKSMIDDLTKSEESIELLKSSILTSSILEVYRILLQSSESSIVFNTDNVGIVDVRDVATLHIMAMEKRQAKGNRFICCHSTRNYLETFNHISEVFREQFHVENVNFISANKSYQESSLQMKKIDGSKAEKILGLQYTPLEKTIREMCQAFVELKFVDSRPAREDEKHSQRERYTVIAETLFP